MSLGIHKSAVSELIDLFRNIAKSDAFPNAPHADITDLETATQAAWKDVHGADELTWSDIRSNEMRVVWDNVYASCDFKNIETDLQHLIEDLSNLLVKHFRGDTFELIGEDVILDMQNSIYARAVGGASNQFFEKIIAAYRQGAWPCGWQGEYPSGKLITFAQHERDSTDK